MMPQTPPKLPLYFLRWFCNDARLEELEGDLYEVWWERKELSGARRANLLYWWLVLRSLRRFALKRNRTQNKIGFFMFLQHHLKVTYRNLWKYRVTTLINVLGLSVGLSAFIAIMTFVAYENSFNHHIPDGDRIYRIYSDFSGSIQSKNRGVSTAVVPFLRENEPSLRKITSFYTKKIKSTPQKTDDPGTKSDTYEKVRCVFAESSFFEVFAQYEWLAGNPRDVLNDPFQVVLSEKQAIKYFGSQPWSEILGKRITYEDSVITIVKGVIRQLPGNTDFFFTDFISKRTIAESWLNEYYSENWSYTNSYSQAWIKTAEKPESLDNPTFLQTANRTSDEFLKDESFKKTYRLQPLEDLHSSLDLGIFDGRGRAPANTRTLIILSIVSTAILLLAIFNFINLESAQVTTKSKEAGVRKVIGGTFAQLLHRFLVESLAITFLAIVLAIPLAHYGLIYFESFLPEPMPLNWGEPMYWGFLVGVFLVVGFIAGIYPALLLSSVKTSDALRSSAQKVSGKSLLTFFRKVALSFQFGFSQFLIICTIAAFLQLDFLLEKDLGFIDDNILLIDAPWRESEEKFQVFKSSLESESRFTEVLWQSAPPPSVRGYSMDNYHATIDDRPVVVKVERKRGEKHYLDFYGIELLAGDFWDSNNQQNQIIVNEQFLREAGLSKPEDALGLRINDDWDGEKEYFTIVGVMEDFHSRSLKSEILPVMLLPLEGYENILSVKVRPDDLLETLNVLSEKWDALYADYPQEITFLDEEIREYYEAEQQLSQISGFSTIMAIFISALGLFGLVSLTIINRTKEVGIRKVMGATGFQIGFLITREFLLLTLIAFGLAFPGAFWVIEQWMASFAYRIPITWWVYLAGGLVSFIVALLAIGSKVYQTTQADPVKALRYE